MIASHPCVSLFGRGIRGLFQMIKKSRPLLALLACLLGAPALAAYTDNGDGTVTDTATGLMWQRCAVGQTWIDSTCSGNATWHNTWDEVKALTSSFAGHTDWRLPSPWELVSIVDYDIYDPAINQTIFPNTPSSGFWSGSLCDGAKSFAWLVDFYDGSAYSSFGRGSLGVRLVRGGQSFGALTTPTSDFVDNGDGTVTHKKTGLIWKRCTEGTNWTGRTCSGTIQKYTYDQAVALTTNFAGQSDWRTPNIQELVSIVEYGASYPAINTAIFPNTPSSYFWSGSTDAYISSYAWVVDFSYGSADDTAPSLNYGVRLVRSGQPFGTFATLTVAKSGAGTGIIASDTGGINCGSTCSASYASGTSVTLTAIPASGSYFYGWSGACSGTASCVVTMNAAKDVTATFKTAPFVATTTSIITPTSATISTTVSFDPADVGKTGAVYITAWTPANGLGALGILAAPMSHALSVTVTNDNPFLGGKINTRQETLATLLAAADPNAFVLVQLTSSGWQLVQNGQLIPYASGVLGDSMAALSILNNANPSNLLGAQFCVGYGTTAAEMVASGRMMPVADIPGSTVATNGSCNVAANPYKGLWYNRNESGWGMSVTQHDSINFVALYTYDPSAQPAWYVMSDCRIATAGSCTGDIYKVVGGKPPTTSWVALNFAQALSTAGRGTLTFSDTHNGKFDFTLNGVTGSKTIERQLFSSGTAAQALDYTDLWWNANESGWGVALTQDMGMLFAAWYTYDAAGQPVWYVASSCPLSGSGCTGAVYKVTGGEALTAAWNGINPVDTVGTVTFAFSDSSTGTMSYTIDGVSGSKAIVRQAF